LFRQERVGQFGKRFTFLKFRSMYVDNDPSIHKQYICKLIKCADTLPGANGNGTEKVFKITDDPRVTRIGRILRRTSLDELPQIWNVLMGDMSLVGPRPPIPYELENYDLWHRRRILEMKPGITGLWQVYGRSRTTFDEMVRLDIRYTIDWSLWLDIKLLLHTPWAVVTSKGAY
jgi:lipopolysaccharide/colanic/teichoic acid biosynthesis glycosyltransferase